jgi:hypothetical protein
VIENVVARDGVEPFWGVCYQSNPLESRTALPFRDSKDRLTVQIQYTEAVGFSADGRGVSRTPLDETRSFLASTTHKRVNKSFFVLPEVFQQLSSG